MDLSIVIVNYNGGRVLQSCLDSIFASRTHRTYEVIVVDNASTDDSLAVLQPFFGRITVIKNHANFGFAAGNNIGVDGASGNYLFLLNNDTILDPDAIESLCGYIDGQTEVGIVSPMLLNSDGTVQGHGSSLTRWLYNTQSPTRVDFVVGAAMVISSELYREVGGFDEGYFFYNEDLDLCKTIRKRGKSIVYFPFAKVIHLGGASTQTLKAASIIEGYRGGLYFCRKHYGKIVYYAYSKLLFFDLLPRFLSNFLRGLYDPDRAALAEAYITVMKIALTGRIENSRRRASA